MAAGVYLVPKNHRMLYIRHVNNITIKLSAMKQALLVLATVAFNLLFCISLSGQTDSLTLLKQKDTVIAKKDLQIAKLDSANKMLAKIDTSKALAGEVCKTCCATAKLGFKQWLLVFLPVIFTLLLGFYFIRWIRKDGFKLADALSATQATTATVVERRTDPANPVQPVVETTTTAGQEPVRSTSRFVAFVTGIAAIIIAVSLVTYYAYFAIAGCPAPPNYEDLWKILAGLGIGVIPYGVNVWNNNTKENNPTNK
jgi:hypothetical protein